MAKNKKEEIEEAVEEAALPKDYILRPGDKYVPIKPEDADQHDMSNYYISDEAEPEEVDDQGSMKPHQIGVTLWYNFATGKVYRFSGKDEEGKSIWKEDLRANRYVLQVEGEKAGELIGEITNANREREAALDEAARAELASRLEGTEVTVSELLADEAAEDGTDDDDVSGV